jgi:hypothetical protein
MLKRLYRAEPGAILIYLAGTAINVVLALVLFM